MSNNEDEIVTEEDETFGEQEMRNASYQLDATEFEDNDEGTVEYLDLDFEVDSIPDGYIPEAPASKTKPPSRSYLEEAKSGHRRTASVTGHNATGSVSSIVATTESENIISRSTGTSGRARKRKMESPASVTLHAAVNAINAKLADSARSTDSKETSIVRGADSQSAFCAPLSQHLESLPRAKKDVKSEGDSLDLFFQSMAQTVLNLPSQVQAKIKMDICKVITMAEIKYCSSNALADANQF